MYSSTIAKRHLPIALLPFEEFHNARGCGGDTGYDSYCSHCHREQFFVSYIPGRQTGCELLKQLDHVHNSGLAHLALCCTLKLTYHDCKRSSEDLVIQSEH